MSRGYLVVLKAPADVQQSYNPRYRGLYRMRPFHIDEYEKGFDDPYMSGQYTDDHGLIPTVALARQVLEKYSDVERADAFEIIYAKDEPAAATAFSDSVGHHFLGYDVACDAPFWSIVVDAPSDPRFLEWLNLNQNGLFESAEHAIAYLNKYRSQFPEKQDVVLKIWELYLVE